MTLKECLANSAKSLNRISESPITDARLFLTDICNLEEKDFILNSNRVLTDEEVEEFDDCIMQRQKGIPVAYILGHKDFWKYTFSTPPQVLIPQPDTETVIEAAMLDIPEGNEISILDLCAGTGCIGICLAKEIAKNCKTVELYLSDISEKAYECFTENSYNLLWEENINPHRYLGNLFEPFAGKKFDIIVTNPPYIESDVIQTLPPEVQAEPHLALDGGKDGLDLIRKITEEAPAHLTENGRIYMEVGYNQGPKVASLFEAAGFKALVFKDLGNRDRVVKGQRK